VVGGEDASPREFPFVVSLHDEKGAHYCGGSLIGDKWVLTAAHCKTPTTVKIGMHETVPSSPSKCVETRQVKRSIQHPKYKYGGANGYDIRLIEIDAPSVYKPVHLYKKAYPDLERANRRLLIAGWGTTEEGGKQPDVLQKLAIPVVADEICGEEYDLKSDSSQICAGNLAGGQDSCQGDSGGPLFSAEEDQFSLVGIVSYGYGCARKGIPGVYTRVSKYLDWVCENTDGALCQTPSPAPQQPATWRGEQYSKSNLAVENFKLPEGSWTIEMYVKIDTPGDTALSFATEWADECLVWWDLPAGKWTKVFLVWDGENLKRTFARENGAKESSLGQVKFYPKYFNELGRLVIGNKQGGFQSPVGDGGADIEFEYLAVYKGAFSDARIEEHMHVPDCVAVDRKGLYAGYFVSSDAGATEKIQDITGQHPAMRITLGSLQQATRTCGASADGSQQPATASTLDFSPICSNGQPFASKAVPNLPINALKLTCSALLAGAYADFSSGAADSTIAAFWTYQVEKDSEIAGLVVGACCTSQPESLKTAPAPAEEDVTPDVPPVEAVVDAPPDPDTDGAGAEAFGCENVAGWVHSQYAPDTCADYAPGGISAQYGCDEETTKNCCASCTALANVKATCENNAGWVHSQYAPDTCDDYQPGGKSAQYGCDEETKQNCCASCTALASPNFASAAQSFASAASANPAANAAADVKAECNQWAAQGDCDNPSYKEQMALECSMSCQLIAECKDTDANCAEYTQDPNECKVGQYAAWNSVYCCQSCKGN
jgi:hypothetical protein